MISATDRRQVVELIEQAIASGAGVNRSCDELQISLRIYQHRTMDDDIKVGVQSEARHFEPANNLTEQEREKILEHCNYKAYRSLPHSQIVRALADTDTYIASESSFYRVLRAADQLQHRGTAPATNLTSKPKGYKATKSNQVWSGDINYLASTVVGGFFRFYLVMDIYNRKVAGWGVHDRETAEYASTLLSKACLAEGIKERGFVLYSDNGSPKQGKTMLATLQRFGVVPSFSRPSVSNENPYSESLFGTMKYKPAYLSKPYETMTAARDWVQRFVLWYNEEHHHGSIQFVTPAVRHSGAERAILDKRKAVYDAARLRHPERRSGETRNWTPVDEVWLNPENSAAVSDAIIEKAA